MADEGGKVTPAPEESETAATAEGESAPADNQEAEPAQESAPPTAQPADASAADTEETKEVKTDDVQEETAEEKPAGEAQETAEKEEGQAQPAATDAPVEAPDQEGTVGAEVADQEAGGDAGQDEQKLESDEKAEAEAPPEQPQADDVDEPKPQEEPGHESDETPLPKSEDFTAGEQPEAPIHVTVEELSREGTPTMLPDGGIEENEMVQPGTPDKERNDDGIIIEEEEEEQVPKISREELVEKYHAALQEREMLNQKNHALQHKLAEYFKRKKTEDSRQEVDRNVTDQEQRYMKYMSNLDELRQQEAGERESYNEQIEEMKERRAVKQTLVEEEWKQYCDFKRSVALASVNSRSGRPLTLKEFEVYELNEVKKEAEVSQVRLENIKLKNRLRKRELQLKQKEELAEGLHLIDFEQLKIENQTYNEKIEERNEELMKLRKKITSTVQVLTHLKEKLQFVQGENQVAKQELAHIEAEVAGKRDILSRTKQARDALRHDNSKLQQKCGLLGNRLLLRDYEEGVDEIGDLSHRLDQLKRTHAELTLSISGVKKKIEQARMQQQS